MNSSQIIKNLSLRIAKGNRAIIWGEHGTGKHVLVKLIMCVYMLEDNCDETESQFYIKGEDGQACILGYDVTKVNLRELRAKISYLDGGTASCFKSTIRQVIDPRVEYTDKDILELVEYFGLMQVIENFLRSQRSKKISKRGAMLFTSKKEIDKMTSIGKKLLKVRLNTF